MTSWAARHPARATARVRDELQVVILSLLSEQPAHGYEVMRTLEERSGGSLRAEAPAWSIRLLTYLEEIGHAAVTQDANRKLYSITDAGRAHLEANGERVTAILEMLKRIGGRMAAVREAYAGLGDADPGASDELSQARHALKHALMRKRGSGPDGDAPRCPHSRKRRGRDLQRRLGLRRWGHSLRGSVQLVVADRVVLNDHLRRAAVGIVCP